MRSEGCRMCVNWIWSSHQWKKWIKSLLKQTSRIRNDANVKWDASLMQSEVFNAKCCNCNLRQPLKLCTWNKIWSRCLKRQIDHMCPTSNNQSNEICLCIKQQACLLIWFRRFPQQLEPSIKINFSFPCSQLSPIEFALDWQQLELWQFRETKCQNWLLATSKSSERFRGFISANTPRSRPSSWD